AGMLHSLPGAFQKHSMLRVDDVGFARGKTEKSGIEQIRAFKRGCLANEVGIASQGLRDAGGVEIGFAEAIKRFHAVADVVPELIEVRGSRKAAGHADDGNGVTR